MSGHIAIGALAAARMARGVTNDRQLDLVDATGAVSAGAGTYTLRDPAGADVPGCIDLTVTSGAVSVPVPTDATLGPGYVEIWTMASIGGRARVITTTAVVQTWTLAYDEVLCGAYAATQRYGYIGTLLARGQSSWDASATIASQRVLADHDIKMEVHGGQLISRVLLAHMAADALCAEIFRVIGSNGNEAALRMADTHEAAYASWWTSASAKVDTSGDGAADVQRAASPAATPGAGSL